jgi:hypothetical protein
LADDINKQVHWFDHQFVRAGDFETEQAYLNDRRWRHTSGFHSAGIVTGLAVTRAGASTTYHVAEGWAVDADGHEGIVLAPGVDVTANPDEWIWLVPDRVQSTPSTDPGLTQFDTRWDETPRVIARAAAAVVGTGPNDVPANAVLLAKIDAAGAADLTDRQEVQIRESDTIRSRDIREADGTTGQNTSIGSGVKTDHIQNGAVTNAKLAANAVESVHIAVADGTSGQATGSGTGVKTNHIQNGAVTGDKIAGAAVDTAQLKDGAVTNDKIADGTITPAKLDQTQNFPATSVLGDVTLWNQDPAVTPELRVPLRWISNNRGALVGSLQIQRTPASTGGALAVAASLVVDEANLNSGTVGAGLTLGNASGEGIGSKRTAGGNQFGLDLYTQSQPRLSITNNGFVGIGTTVPAAALQVLGGAIMPSVGNSETAGIQFPPDPGGGAGDRAYIRYFVEAGESTKLLIGCDNDADDRIAFRQAGQERLIISGGNVGIATTNPQRRLHVNGTEIHSGGTGGGFSFGDRVASEFVEAVAGDHRGWYSQGRLARLWTAVNGDRIGVGGGGELFVDVGNSNTGTLAPGIFFGGPGSGEAVSSRRSGTPASDSTFGIDFFTAFLRRMTIKQNGNVGIGTANPQSLLHVNGTIQCTALSIPFPGKVGYVFDQFVNRLGEALEEGDVVVLGDTEPSLSWGTPPVPIPEVDLAAQEYDTRVCGIVAHTWSTIDEGEAGRARRLSEEELAAIDRTRVEPGQVGALVTLGAFATCKVDADVTPIAVGDLLTTSATPGHAQKAVDMTKATGAILGKALGTLQTGKGRIPVLVLLH